MTRGEHTPGIVAQRDLAWGRNAVAFIRERGLETEFNDWCGGWPCPVEATSPDLISELVGALEPFAAVAEHDIGDDEADDDRFRPITHNHAPHLTVGDLRRARAVATKARGGAA